jgi:hypothetical protein
MTMTDTSTSPHLDDGELMTLDGEPSGASSADARAHLASCARCADRLRVLRKLSSNVSSRIAEVELPNDFRYPALPAAAQVRPLRSSWTQRNWRRAAAVLLVIGSFAAVSPLRAWTVGWIAKGVGALTGANRGGVSPTNPVTRDTAQVAPPIDSGATLWFAAEGPELAVEIARPQTTGTLTLSAGTRPMVGVEVVNGAGETPLVRERGVRLINNAASTASYRLAIPAGVQRIRVRIGDQAWRTLTRADVDAGRAIELR